MHGQVPPPEAAEPLDGRRGRGTHVSVGDVGSDFASSESPQSVERGVLTAIYGAPR